MNGLPFFPTTSRFSRLLLSGALATLILSGCKAGYPAGGTNTDKPDSPSNPDTTVFRGPGSSWTYSQNIGSNGFTLSRRTTPDLDETPDWTVSGTYGTNNSSRFFELNITDPGDTSLTTGSIIYGIQVSSEITLLSPFISGTDTPLALVQAGCPTTLINTNWLTLKRPATLNESQHTGHDFGTSEVSLIDSDDGTDLSFRLNQTYDIQSPTTPIGNASRVLESSCSNGVVTGASGTRAYVSTSGAMIIERATSTEDLDQGATANSEFLFALQSKDVLATTDFDAGSYVGLFTDSTMTDGQKTSGAKAECASGSCTITLYQTFAGLQEGNSYNLNLETEALNAPSSGLLSGTLTNNSNNSQSSITCSINTDYNGSGQYFIACIGGSPGADNSTVNLFLVAGN